MDNCIRRRAAQLGVMGEYVGIFDLLVYADMKGAIVKTWLGSELLDLLHLFAPVKRALMRHDAPEVYLVATRIENKDTLPVDDIRQVNHWIGASRMAGMEGIENIDDDANASMFENHHVLQAAIQHDVLPILDEGLEDIRFFYRARGFHVHATAAQGDCAIDALALSEGKERNPITWLALRSELMEHMWMLAADENWQHIWTMCGEDQADPDPEAGMDEDITPAVLDQGSELAVLDQGSALAVLDQGAEDAKGFLEGLRPGLVDEFMDACGFGNITAGVSEALQEHARDDLALARCRARHLTAPTKQKPKSGQQVRATLNDRISMGLAFNEYKRKNPKAVKNKQAFVRQFCKAHLPSCAWNRQMGKRVVRAGKLAATYKDAELGKRSQGRQVVREKHVASVLRKNRRTRQGQPLKAIAVEEALFAWFVDIRGSVVGRLPSAVVLARARQLLMEYVATQLSAGLVPRMPRVNSCWIFRWAARYGVSFRKPNRRFKLSRRGLLVRLRILWLNNIRVRYYAIRMLGVDPGEHLDNADQKGWHVNQAGSKEAGTLELSGAARVDLKENHAATRERLSFMTYCSNNLERIRRGLPLETCFKVQSTGERILADLTVPSRLFSVRVSDSGSYREEHVYLYLELHLEPATEDRRRRNDWRLFYLDIYSGHLSLRIWQICWDRMYILQFHGGGLTGMTQVNDLWLHHTMELEIGKLEAFAYLRKGLVRPGKVPTLTRQEILNNATTAWQTSIPHERSIAWTKATGLSLPLEEEAFVILRIALRSWTRCFVVVVVRSSSSGSTVILEVVEVRISSSCRLLSRN